MRVCIRMHLQYPETAQSTWCESAYVKCMSASLASSWAHSQQSPLAGTSVPGVPMPRSLQVQEEQPGTQHDSSAPAENYNP